MPVEKTASPSVWPTAPNDFPVKTRPSSSTSTALVTSAAPPHRFVPREREVPPPHRRRRKSRGLLEPAVVFVSITCPEPGFDLDIRWQSPPNGQYSIAGGHLSAHA